MSKQHKRGLHLVRRDLRLVDNVALNQAARECESVLAVFIFDPRQVEQRQNPYFAKRAFQFMIESLAELEAEIAALGGELLFLYGEPSETLAGLIAAEGVEAVYANEDYTPFAKKRDQSLKTVCDEAGVSITFTPDAYLTRPGEVCTEAGSVYTVFTPFMKKASELPVPKPHTEKDLRLVKASGSHKKITLTKLLPESEREGGLAEVGGRKAALRRLKAFAVEQYPKQRDFPAESGTSRLSAHLKFGTLSVREVYEAVSGKAGAGKYVSELYWRDFYVHLLSAKPELLGLELQEKYRDVKWDYDEEKFAAWCEGRTGFPIVDAGMRELNQTGWMHNRVRMIAASFLTKDLHLDWRSGEKYFASQLTDYDPASNNGGWQWAASTGADAQPYFRIFNPWLQQERFDPKAEYIKKFVPELASLSAEEIHKLETKPAPEELGYPAPIVEHKKERLVALERFKS